MYIRNVHYNHISTGIIKTVQTKFTHTILSLRCVLLSTFTEIRHVKTDISRRFKGQWQLVRRHRSSISISVQDRVRWHQISPGVKLQHVGWWSPHRKSASAYCSFQRSGRFPWPPWTAASPCWEQTHTAPIWLGRHMPSSSMPCVITDGQSEDRRANCTFNFI